MKTALAAAAEFFGEDAQLQIAETNSAVLLGIVVAVQPRSTILRQSAASLGSGPSSAPHRHERAFVSQEGLGLFAQQVLFVGKLEIMGTSWD
jgi:hypothetical protein